METMPSSTEYTLRCAVATDMAVIRKLISLVRINPTGLNWRRFTIAIDRQGNIIGCGQVKPHGDGSLELASIAVLPAWRGNGIARTIIDHLLQQYPGTLYLTCRSELGPMYQKFGFRVIPFAEMTPYFQRLSRIVILASKLLNQPARLLVMRRN
jgi:N-acetylglutamate synthase-like GNAT family acetyltransferase